MEDKKPKRQAATQKAASATKPASAERKTRTAKAASPTLAEGEKKPRATRSVKNLAPSDAAMPEKDTKAKAKQVAPKKESAGAASKRKSKVSTVSKPVKKKQSDTPFWAPFAKKEKPAPAKERDERSGGHRESREERPSKGPAGLRRDEREERPSRQGREERPSQRKPNAGKPFAQRPDRRQADDGSDRPRRDAFNTSGPKDGPAKFAKRKPMGMRPPAPKGHSPAEMEEPMRLNKFLAHCGIAARRQAAEYVKKGLVTVNGTTETNPSYTVQPSDEVRYKGEVVRLETQKVYILMNKPRDIITTSNDERGRRTVLDLIGNKVEERIFPVGRLDRMTSGLLLLTNDGDLAKKLSHPSHKVQKVYHVTLDKPFHKADFEKVQKGLNLEDGLAMVDSLHYIEGKKDELEIGIHIGKNRIVRRIFEHLGYEVIKLDRTYYAGLTKKDIGRGHFRHLTEQEVVMLKHFK